MVWIRLSLSCIAFLSITGSIAFGMIKLAGRLRCIENLLLLSALQKLGLILYWLPLSFLCVCIPRISFENGVKAYSGEFVCSAIPSMTNAFYLLGSIWLSGFLLSVARAGVKKRKLTELVRGNVPVQNPLYFNLFEECRDQAGVDEISLSRNDLLSSPVSVGFVRKQVILPFADYTETELRMIYEHELMHIKNKDLQWRMLALATSWIHWFNPMIHMYLKELECVQEIVCDLSISVSNVHFSKKEYAAFLAKLSDQETFYAGMPALTENKKQTIRRIEAMAKTVTFIEPGKKIMGLSCACLALLALIPSTAVSAKVAKLQEDRMRAEEVETIEEPQDFSDPSIEEHGYADGSVVEIDGSEEIVPYSVTVDLKKTISANTRYLYQYRSMSAGESISITAKCSDNAVTYRIGIKNKETGDLTSISGSGTLIHEFKLSKDGTYTAFVENCSSISMNVSGSAVY